MFHKIKLLLLMKYGHSLSLICKSNYDLDSVEWMYEKWENTHKTEKLHHELYPKKYEFVVATFFSFFKSETLSDYDSLSIF